MSIKKARGRPRTGVGKPLMIRCHEDFLMMLDEYRREQADLPSRSEAVRRLVQFALQEISRQRWLNSRPGIAASYDPPKEPKDDK